MITGSNTKEPVFKRFLGASADYVGKLEGLALAVKFDDPHLAQLLGVLARETAQIVNLVSRLASEQSVGGVEGGTKRPA